MKISEVQIVPIKPRDGVIAFASCVLDESLYVGSIAIMTRRGGGYRLVYPTRKIGDASIPVYHPIHSGLADELTGAILKKLKEITNE